MRRKVEHSKTSIKTELQFLKNQDVKEWLETQAQAYPETRNFFLLAHADDGVIWGKLVGGKLEIAPLTEFSPPLRTETLQNAWLFSKNVEIYLWRDGAGEFHTRIITDGSGEEKSYFDEEQILWGDHAEKSGNDFTLMSDGSQDLRHYVPLPFKNIVVETKGNYRPLRLKVRHYLTEDETGFVRVAYSRLVDLTAK